MHNAPAGSERRIGIFQIAPLRIIYFSADDSFYMSDLLARQTFERNATVFPKCLPPENSTLPQE